MKTLFLIVLAVAALVALLKLNAWRCRRSDPTRHIAAEAVRLLRERSDEWLIQGSRWILPHSPIALLISMDWEGDESYSLHVGTATVEPGICWAWRISAAVKEVRRARETAEKLNTISDALEVLAKRQSPNG